MYTEKAQKEIIQEKEERSVRTVRSLLTRIEGCKETIKKMEKEIQMIEDGKVRFYEDGEMEFIRD